jgi:hypothetical protein
MADHRSSRPSIPAALQGRNEAGYFPQGEQLGRVLALIAD